MLLPRLRDQVSAFINVDLAIVARARGFRASLDGGAGEFGGYAFVDAGFARFRM